MDPNAPSPALQPPTDGVMRPTDVPPAGRFVSARPVPVPSPAGGEALRRIDAPCEALGFSAPPCAVHLRFSRTGPEWTLDAQAPPGRPADVARWLAPHRPALTSVEPGLSPRSLRAVFEELPAAWSRLLSGLSVRYVDLRPEGVASVFVDGGDVDRFLDDLGPEGRDGVRVRPAATERCADVLTARQREALSLAVALGYFEVPHRVDMRGLAQRMGVSLGAMSELLRRGQSAILHGFFDALSAERWHGVE